jgi:2-polyprenyl-3-methyl-5-hydroxy-6-metoxy-1,4-benzoquinol methylase
MDEPGIDPKLLAWALRDLDRLNRWGRTAAGLAASVRRLGRAAGADRELTVVDLGCGGGGVTLELAGRLEGAGRWRVVGVDAADTCIGAARAAADRRGASVDFHAGRIGEASLEAITGGPVDVVVSSLFLHHLDDDTLDGLLAACAASARIGVVMDDLRRDRWSMALVRLGTRALSRCPVVHVDGPRSVRAALTPAELAARARRAGLPGARVRRVEPARMRLEWCRSAATATAAAATEAGA